MGKGESGIVIYIKREEIQRAHNAGKPVSFLRRSPGLPRSENTDSRVEHSFYEKTLTILPLVFPLPCHAGRHRLHRHLVRTLPAHCALLRGAQWQIPFRDFREGRRGRDGPDLRRLRSQVSTGFPLHLTLTLSRPRGHPHSPSSDLFCFCFCSSFSQVHADLYGVQGWKPAGRRKARGCFSRCP